ncbi:beta-N-acetylhexosaminidase [Acholeplasma vituli]|uniref:Beta-N-acetylhexosaminidase n=1 Tax=Paracholeplasma vituli TaxID=69473 RepID=A0ABT2PX02_9MOLU|nr:beta-N-acetylhexosaminidase [Paracholeplasma vituli]MCU0104267.1 beta-N-acetylhexosaminidase [Paracholeplasma vituli]
MKDLLEQLKIQHKIKHFIVSDETKQESDTLYYKSIPSALLYLKHLETTGISLPDDGFSVKGTMVDLSRNAVFKIDYFKSVIRRQALMGFNQIWLYMEDVYELKDYPKFGYLRGKYTQKELKDLDDYAFHLGVELVPCIQTLGHMGQFLRWPSSSPFKDQADVLRIDTAKPLIEAMIDFCQDTFRTNQIHIGMDETFGFSLGTYYKKHGYHNPEDLFLEHLNWVYSLCKQKGYAHILMWSDMFFRHRSQTEYYYDTTITFEEAFLSKIPKDITMVYWDYYNLKPEVYEKMIQIHQKMGLDVVMASGTWIWTKLIYDQEQTQKTAKLAIEAAQKCNLKKIIFTHWQDDGAYVDYESVFLGLFDVTKWMTKGLLSPVFYNNLEEITHENWLVQTKINQLGYYPVKLLWDDLLLGIYLNDLTGYEPKALKPYIQKTKQYLKELKTIDAPHAKALADVLRLKLEIRQACLEDYFTTKTFSRTIRLVKQFKLKMKSLIESFEGLWHDRYRPFGLEVLQTRLFGQIRRADELLYWIDQIILDPNQTLPFFEEVLSKEPYMNFKYLDYGFSSKQ